ncbi:MAG: hypothetical protein A3C27_01635 [Candidatus Levybacteria bacterium RIFCSPHIGHO2_02_FULL_39_36]|nr:MAG: hypothetical protein A3C27_01635 [Candidatus Levybacteria bacterium RIFCSPHIGHO2_02_FULL_39_36]OGH36216.1 MAG: hypothetical protein A3B43_00875 [Candidatus Levybacteria bacterium RIFCSPLOWO2_01_FULL_38_120]OGH45539.1 MAG: hypothetical protein A3H82_00610 [Candidatus Levybacteria bacterium RIFCSPLOWO2_02_FULL_39_26]OGH47986.1 MAG: hypothetical protein A3G66_00905 [Candidatus Levybacteria bacterium RIFCSPLOWO2_12_FULL_39_17]
MNYKIKNKGSGQARPGRAGAAAHLLMENIMLPRRVITQIADEVGKVVSKSLSVGRKRGKKKNKQIENPVFLDTSAIIDMRVFDLAKIGAFYGTFMLLEGVLSELKNIADSKDGIKKDRGRKALDALEAFRKAKGVKVRIMADYGEKSVDEDIIDMARKNKGRIITCDYNLSKKARISGVPAIDLYEMTNILKTTALPGEEFWVKIIQSGKGEGQGVGYLPDGTMLVVERGKEYVGKTIQVKVSRIIQTDAGKILFSKIKTPDN